MTVALRRATDALTARPYTIAAIRQQTYDTVTLDFDASADPIVFAPGQFDMLYLFGIGEAVISISSDPAEPARISHTLRAVGSVTRALAEAQPGTAVGIRGPFGRPWPMAAAEGGDLVVVAGGIGLAPVRPVILRALAQREHFGRLLLLVGARTPRDLVFRHDLQRWQDDPRITVAVTVDRATRGWGGTVGVVTRTIARASFDPERTTAFTCGPEVMMHFAAQALIGRGVPAERVHLSLERNMRCGVGTCGHCQLGPVFVCRDGPVFAWPEVSGLLEVREL